MTVFESVCLLLCGVGVFLTGMKLMGDGLGKGSAKSIKKIFAKISNNRFALYGLGAGATAIVQSSAATTVMSMGLVSAGIMSTFQASAFVLGARLGTTVTGILVSLSAIKITPVLMALAFVGICLILFVNNEGVKSAGYIVTGLGVLFSGMSMMTDAITGQPQISTFFIRLFNAIDYEPLLVLVGVAFTALIQSSSATTGLMITLLNAGTVEVSQAVFIIIGATVGTCITSLLASVGAEKNAKRVAFFNLFTAIIGVIVIGGAVWIFEKPILYVLSFIQVSGWQVSLFGVFYSLLAGLVCLPMIKPLHRLTERIVKDKEKKEEFSFYYIKETSLRTPQVAVMQVKKEVDNLLLLAMENLWYGFEIMLTGNEARKKRVETEEERIDFLTQKISEFLVKLAAKDLSYSDEHFVGSLHHVIDDIERIGDHGMDFLKMEIKMSAVGIEFSEEAKGEIKQLYDEVCALYRAAEKAFSENNKAYLSEVNRHEKSVDEMKKMFADRHVERLNAGKCTVETGSYFYSAIASLERVGDHLENVGYSIRNITGSVK